MSAGDTLYIDGVLRPNLCPASHDGCTKEGRGSGFGKFFCDAVDDIDEFTHQIGRYAASYRVTCLRSAALSGKSANRQPE